MLSVYAIHPPLARYMYVQSVAQYISSFYCSEPSDMPTYNQTLSTDRFTQNVPLSCEKKALVSMSVPNVDLR